MGNSHWMDGDLGGRWDGGNSALGMEDCPTNRQTVAQWIDAEFQWEGLYEFNPLRQSRVKQEIPAASWKPSKVKTKRKGDSRLSLFLSLSMSR